MPSDSKGNEPAAKAPAGKRSLAKPAPKTRRELLLSDYHDRQFTDIMKERGVNFQEATHIVLAQARRRQSHVRRSLIREKLKGMRVALAAATKSHDREHTQRLCKELDEDVVEVGRLLNGLGLG